MSSPTIKLRILCGQLSRLVPQGWNKMLLIKGDFYSIKEGCKHLGEKGGTLIATPKKTSRGGPMSFKIDPDGWIIHEVARCRYRLKRQEADSA